MTKEKKWLLGGFSLVAVVFALVVTFFFGSEAASARSETKKTAPRSAEEERTIQVYRQAREAVVFISTITLKYDPFDVFMELHPSEGSGSGTIVDAKRGIVLTNLHVISDAHKIEILLPDGGSAKARLVGYDKEYDLAVLQLVNPPAGLKEVPFGSSADLEVGQRVLAIGNPFGLSSTLTTGIVSSLERSVRNADGTLLHGLIQTDAAINPGNSGGPLLDSAGRFVGLTTAILSNTGSYAGISFAVPADRIAAVLPELIATGRVLRPEIGWVLVDTNHGPMVRRTIENGPADKAGIQPIERRVSDVFVQGYIRDFDRADLVFRINGKRVRSRREAEELINRLREKKSLTITLRRGGNSGPERTVEVRPILR